MKVRGAFERSDTASWDLEAETMNCTPIPEIE
jgi:hypothetical protein